MAFGAEIQVKANSNTYADQITATLDSTATLGNLLVCIHFTGATTSNAPSGFTEAVQSTNTTNADEIAMYWKVSAGTETAVTPTCSAKDDNMVLVWEFEGPWETSPVDGSDNVTEGTRTTTSSGTTGATAQNDEVAVAAWGVRAVSPSYSGYTNSFGNQQVVSTGAYKSMAAAYKLLTTTGAQECSVSHNSAVSIGMIATFKKEGGGPPAGIVVLRRRREAA